jgi:hypothetical protein
MKVKNNISNYFLIAPKLELMKKILENLPAIIDE